MIVLVLIGRLTKTRRFIIVKENDNYEDVASRYEIDESIIRDYNQDKPLVAGNVLIIPYVCK